MVPPDTEITTTLKAFVDALRANPVARHAFDEPSRFRAILDLGGVIVEVNDYTAAASETQVERGSMVGYAMCDIAVYATDSSWHQIWVDRLAEASTSPTAITYDDEFPTDEFGPFGVHGELSLIRGAEGEPIGYYLEVTNVDLVREAQGRLRNSEARFRAMTEALPQMVWTSTGEGRVDYLSPRWAEFTGKPVEELLGPGFTDLIHPDDRAAVLASSQLPRDPGEPVMFRMQNAAGEWRWMESRMDAIVVEEGDGVRWFGATLDVTTRRDAEDYARKQQEQLRATLELTGYGTYVWYVPDDRFSDDSQLDTILNIPMDELKKGNAFELFFGMVHPEDRPFVEASVLGAIVPGGPDYEAEFRMIVPAVSGSGTEERWVSAMGRVEFNTRDEPIRLVGVFADITGRRHEDESRLRLQKIEAMGTLASGIAHDFNNVIGAILSYARVAEAELAAGESPATSIAEIARGALRAGDIVQRMLTFSREEAPRQVAFDLAEVVSEARALVRPTLPPSISINETIEPDLPGVIGDPTQLHQVVVNLLTNAGQAIGDGRGAIEVELDEVTIEHGLSGNDAEPSSYLRLRVRDDGPGMPAAIAERIFDPFFTTKGPEQGTGLGLSAVQSIVANHGGQVVVESVLGEGAQFTVHVPVHVALPEPPAPEPEPTGENEAPQIRILFVDDEEALVRLAHRALPYRGCVVTGYTDPAEALTVFQRNRDGFDALITDLSMPGMTGLQLAEHVRSLRADIPIVLTSGYMRSEEHADAVRRGVDAVVPKPCSIDDLADTVEELLAGRASA